MMGYQSEAQLEKNLNTQLINQGYHLGKIANYNTLLTNFKINLINLMNLN
ncbi:hypothetical protein [Lysinibacillus capsici]|nr:hypothetical protein [Lysinibacillus capsici]